MRQHRRTVRVSREVYEWLKSLKRPGDSFSDVIIREGEAYARRHHLRSGRS